MKIDHIQDSIAGLTQPDSSRKTENKSQENSPSIAPDSVSLSQFGTRIRQLAQKIDPSGMDLDRVNAIKQAIADGSYKISSEGIASGMLKPVIDINTP